MARVGQQLHRGENKKGVSPGGKGGRRLRLTTLLPSCAGCLEILDTSTFCRQKGLPWPEVGQLLKVKECDDDDDDDSNNNNNGTDQ